MAVKSYGKAFTLIATLTLSSYIAYTFFKRKKQGRKEIHDVIMFSDSNGHPRKSKYSRCMITSSMDKLLYYLNSPKQTLDICMYVFTNPDLTNAVLKLHYKGIKVRMIIDADMAYATGSCIRKLEKQGIPVRWMKSTNLMHHKFSLIDAWTDNELETPLVIMGSLNWTNQALSGNWEDIAVTSQRELVQQYRTEFERLWAAFKPIVDF